MIKENSYTLEELYRMYEEKGTTFVIEDGEITGVLYAKRDS